jgi:hypothetical protein
MSRTPVGTSNMPVSALSVSNQLARAKKIASHHCGMLRLLDDNDAAKVVER